MTEAASPRPPGTPCWASLMADRADLAQDFYGGLFGWDFVPGPPQLGSYVMAVLDGRRVAGIGQAPRSPHRSFTWTTMFAADDADHTAELVRECGGTVGFGPLNAGDQGRLAVAVDPSGAVFGIWQGGLLSGADVTGEPGAVAWSELVTYDTTLVGKFYEAVFDFDTQPAAGGLDPDRLLLRIDGRPVADVHGVGGRVPQDRGAHWMTYFEVDGADAAAARAVALGGRVVEPPHDSPYGRIAAVADPGGAAFALITTAR